MKKKLTNIEQKFQSNLSDYGDWNGDDTEMWGAIEEAIDEKKKRRFMIWWIFGGVIGLGILGVGYMNMESAGAPIKTDVLAEISTNKNVENNDISTTLLDAELNNNNNNNNNNNDESEKQTLNSATETNFDIDQTWSKSESISATISTSSGNDGAFAQKGRESMRENEPMNEAIAIGKKIMDKAKFTNIEQVETPLAAQENHVSYLEMLGYSAQSMIIDTVEEPCFVVNIIEEKPSIQRDRRLSIGYFRGVNFHTDGYHFGIAENALRKETERGLIGKEEGVRIEYRIGQDYLIATGIGISQYEERFEYNEVTALQLVENNVIVRYNINTITMDTTFIIGDRVVDGTSERAIRHYNSWKMLRVPVLVGKQWTTNRSAFKLLAGVSVERVIAQETKDSSDDFALFIQSASTPRFSKFGMNVELIPSIERRLGSRFKASVSMPMRYAMRSWDYRDSSFDSFAQKRPLILALNIGLAYEL